MSEQAGSARVELALLVLDQLDGLGDRMVLVERVRAALTNTRHTAAASGQHGSGLDHCSECSAIALEWVAWPCAGSVESPARGVGS